MEFDVKTAVAQGLRALREEKGESQAAIAAVTGVHRVTVNHWENGKGTPSAPQLYLAANHLGTTTDAIYSVGAGITTAREAITKEEK